MQLSALLGQMLSESYRYGVVKTAILWALERNTNNEDRRVAQHVRHIKYFLIEDCLHYHAKTEHRFHGR